MTTARKAVKKPLKGELKPKWRKTPFAKTASGIIRQVVEDVRLCIADQSISFDMAAWHRPLASGKRCVVCLAGAAMHQQLLKPEKRYWHVMALTSCFSNGDVRILIALNYLRSGDLRCLLAGCGEAGISIADRPDVVRLLEDMQLSTEPQTRKTMRKWCVKALKLAELLEAESL